MSDKLTTKDIIILSIIIFYVLTAPLFVTISMFWNPGVLLFLTYSFIVGFIVNKLENST